MAGDGCADQENMEALMELLGVGQMVDKQREKRFGKGHKQLDV